MSKNFGFNQFATQMTDALKAIKALDGELGTVSFNPNDPASIEAAIQNVDTIIDERLGRYASNPIVAPLAESMKEKYRELIIDRAAAARIESENE